MLLLGRATCDETSVRSVCRNVRKISCATHKVCLPPQPDMIYSEREEEMVGMEAFLKPTAFLERTTSVMLCMRGSESRGWCLTPVLRCTPCNHQLDVDE